MGLTTDTGGAIFIGIDVGQLHDPTAIAVAELIPVWRRKMREHADGTQSKIWETEYHIHTIGRLPLGTSYPVVASTVTDILGNPRLMGRHLQVNIDVTGVGRPVGELISQYAKRRANTAHTVIREITFVHGENFNAEMGRLGKAYLVSRLQALLQERLVKMPNTPEARATVEELLVYQINIDQDGKDTYGAPSMKHDDLATALGLACLDKARKTGDDHNAFVSRYSELVRAKYGGAPASR